MHRSFKYRIYPNKAQAAALNQWLDLCRELYNAALEERREAWKQRVSISLRIQQSQLPPLKKIRPDLAGVNSQVLQNVLVRVDRAFRAFFRRVKQGKIPGYPRYKGSDRYQSLEWPQDIGFRFTGAKRLRLSGIGEIRIKLHRPLGGKPKTCTLKRESDRWYAILSCEGVLPSKHLHPISDRQVGLDVGLESFATLSTGEKISNPRWYRNVEERLAKAQRELSRKKRGSTRRLKARLKVAQLHAKARRQREDFQQKLANRLVSENSLIAVENLEIESLAQESPRGIRKSIQDAGWARFLKILADKAEEAGRQLIRVEAAGTSSGCYRCGAYRKKALGERIHSCACGLVLDRDQHAALNILRLGTSLQAIA